ncbi:MAG: hypothetical protein HYR64_05335 [Fimbriimonas ginsengisoli]|uniref:Teneurin-like YD-shell domain-containing protein n=1 Tax=Fimbriimonas ginsengisoli TaxID=1005039 RepID=A0A931LSD1_FIMGI|nr:hypothetical protein [Fimbriimonas ginsengisoli]
MDSATTTYGYDAIDQLTSETAPTFTATYTYDANGNRTGKTQGGVTDTYTVDSGDKLTSTSTKSYTYDAAGRTTGVTSGGQTTTVAYDYEDRITSITYPSTATNTFTYNGLDTRVGKVDSAGTKTCKRDGAGVTDPVLSDGVANYTPGVSERRSGASKFYHSDRMGTDSRLTDSTQATTDTKTFDAFGMLVASTGSTPTPFGYAGAFGYQEDTDSGLKLLGHRYYDPSTGRFLTRDRAKHGRNWYCYCASNPLANLDPDGHEQRSRDLIVAGDTSGIAGGAWPYYIMMTGDLLNGPKRDVMFDRLVHFTGTTVIFWGHGGEGYVRISQGSSGELRADFFIAVQQERARLGLKKIPHIQVDQCSTLADKNFVTVLQQVASFVEGYADTCPTSQRVYYRSIPLYPVFFTPIIVDPWPNYTSFTTGQGSGGGSPRP